MKNMLIPIELGNAYETLDYQIVEHPMAVGLREVKDPQTPFSKKSTHFPQRIRREYRKALLRGSQLIMSLKKLNLSPQILLGKESEEIVGETGLKRTNLIVIGAKDLGAINGEVCEFINQASCPVLILKCTPFTPGVEEKTIFLIDLK